MNEYLFQYLWKHTLYRPDQLCTTDGEPVVVLHPGIQNFDAGPDFLEARIKIGNTTWAGNVELHIRTSDWYRHRHTYNPRYKNIILHIVYEHDAITTDETFPTMVLKKHLEEGVILQYSYLMGKTTPILCSGMVDKVPDIIWHTWFDRLLAERWEQKLQEWEALWKQSGRDWRTLLYYRLAANFGFYTNRDAFLELALSLPLKILVRHRTNLLQTEALLFGQAGLLNSKRPDEYESALEKEYHFLRRKYQLVPMAAHRWKFMRLRPQNFPTIRIAQFAMLVHKSLDLFARMMEVEDAGTIFPLLDLHGSTYWNLHYRFGEKTEEAVTKSIGKDAIYNILINTVAPMQYLYARLQGKSSLHEKSLLLLQSLKAENNRIIREWQDIGIRVKDAARSQALLQLFNQYCSQKNCLNCAVGNRLLRHSNNITS
jgi:hypothetical protein